MQHINLCVRGALVSVWRLEWGWEAGRRPDQEELGTQPLQEMTTASTKGLKCTHLHRQGTDISKKAT